MNSRVCGGVDISVSAEVVGGGRYNAFCDQCASRRRSGRDDLGAFLLSYFQSPVSSNTPLIVLGQPASGDPGAVQYRRRGRSERKPETSASFDSVRASRRPARLISGKRVTVTFTQAPPAPSANTELVASLWPEAPKRKDEGDVT